MAKTHKDKDTVEKARKRFVDQKGQWKNVTPKANRQKIDKAVAAFRNSLSPSERKRLGL